MIRTIDKVRLDNSAQLSLDTGYTVGWAPGSAHYLTGLDGWFGSSPLRRNESPLVGAHGVHSERGYKDARLISVSSHLVAPSRGAAAAYTDTISAFLGDGEAGLFKVSDADLGDRWARVYLATGGVDVDWDGGVDVGSTVHLIATDPRKYGATIYSEATGVPVSGGGLVFPLFGAPADGALDIGRGGYSGRASITNTGTAAAGAVFTVTGTMVPGFTITEVGSGRRLVYTDTVEAGQTLVLNSNNGTTIMDGYNPRGSKLTVAEWSMVAPGGTSSWQFEAPGSVDASLTVAVTPAWW